MKRLIIINLNKKNNLLMYFLVNNGKNESDRIHPFNMWFDRSLSLSPYYEIIYIIQVLNKSFSCQKFIIFN